MTKVINNDTKIAKKIEEFVKSEDIMPLNDLNVVCDDGSVIVNINGLHSERAYDILSYNFGGERVGDGVQEGEVMFIVNGLMK